MYEGSYMKYKKTAFYLLLLVSFNTSAYGVDLNYDEAMEVASKKEIIGTLSKVTVDVSGICKLAINEDNNNSHDVNWDCKTSAGVLMYQIALSAFESHIRVNLGISGDNNLASIMMTDH